MTPMPTRVRAGRPAAVRARGIALALLATVLACSAETPSADTTSARSAPRTAADSQAAHVAHVVAAGGVVDSILPAAEHLRRFRASMPVAPDTLRHASGSIDALVTRWAKAVAARDTAELNRMTLDRAEFAWLYYPDAAVSKPPYEAPPELLWGQILAASDDGARRVLARFGGRELDAGRIRCPDSVEVEGANRIRQHCTMRLRAGGTTTPETRYFGSIIERDGRFKFIGLGNRL